MISVIQRVLSASVTAEGKLAGKIDRGMLLLVGIEKNDDESHIIYTADKIIGLRIFEDEKGRMNLPVDKADGEILAVSQFTLAASVRKGRRPSFDNAMKPEKAELLFTQFVEYLSKKACKEVHAGVFGAEMKVSLENDGPVTFIVDSLKRIP